MDITFDRNLNLINIERDGYTIFDYISDIGGLQGILFSTFAIFLGFFNYNIFDNFMLKRLYQIKKKDCNSKVYNSADDQSETLTFTVFSGVFDAICDSLPSCL